MAPVRNDFPHTQVLGKTRAAHVDFWPKTTRMVAANRSNLSRVVSFDRINFNLPVKPWLSLVPQTHLPCGGENGSLPIFFFRPPFRMPFGLRITVH